MNANQDKSQINSNSIVSVLMKQDLCEWKYKDITYSVNLSNGSNPIAIRVNNRSFCPFNGFGPILEVDETEYTASQCEISVISYNKKDNMLEMACEMKVSGKEYKSLYSLAFYFMDGRLFISINSNDNRIRGVSPGLTQKFGAWKQKNITRYSELYDQNWYSQPVYNISEGFFVFADWEPMEGNATDYRYGGLKADKYTVESKRPFHGEEDMDLLPPARYYANNNGRYMKLQETLSICVSKSMWEAIPAPAIKASEYLEDLRDKTWLDLWDGNARNARYILQQLTRLTNGRAKFITMFQRFGAKWWDATLPDQYWPEKGLLPEGGTVKEIKELVDYGKNVLGGFIGLRTNYVYTSNLSPSLNEGLVKKAKTPFGTDSWFVRPDDWNTVVLRQEPAMKNDFHPNCSLSDQLASGGMTPAFVDYGSEDTSMRYSMQKEKEVINHIKEINPGPFASESSVSEFLLGGCYDYGEYGIMDGYHRRDLKPDYKLRKIHSLAVMYGMGIPYRWFEGPPFPKHETACGYPFTEEYTQGMDDYRACEVMYGNGAYIGYLPNVPYEWMLTETLLVGQLQKQYIGQGVEEIFYFHNGEWKTLEQLYAIDDTDCDIYTRVKIRYENGLLIWVNRSADIISADTFKGKIIIPQAGFAAQKADESIIAYSAFYPGTIDRVDYYEDKACKFLNPRRSNIEGVNVLTLWEENKIIMQYKEDKKFDSVEDFSGVQGKHHWFYELFDKENGRFEGISTYCEDEQKWLRDDAAIFREGMVSSENYLPVRKWVAPYDGRIGINCRIQPCIQSSETGGSFQIFKNEIQVKVIKLQKNIYGSLKVGELLDVNAGDEVRFMAESIGSDREKILVDMKIHYVYLMMGKQKSPFHVQEES